MSRPLENSAQTLAHVLARASSLAAPWSPPPVRPWAVNGWKRPVTPVGLYLQSSMERLCEALRAGGFEQHEAEDLSSATTWSGVELTVTGAARLMGSVVRLSPVTPERALFESLPLDLQRLGGMTQDSTWAKDAPDGTRDVLRLYSAGAHRGRRMTAMTVERHTGRVKRAPGGAGFLPEVDLRFDLVRDEQVELFRPIEVETATVAEPWDPSSKNRVLYRLVLE